MCVPINTLADESITFTPHITIEALTKKQWSLSLNKFPGANLNTSFLLSSISISVHDRLEIGTAPAFYFVDNHKYNINLKYNFYRGRQFQWALGLSQVKYRLEDNDFPNADFTINNLILAVNYHPSFLRLKFGIFYGVVSQRLEKVDALTQALSYNSKREFGIDISYPFKNNIDVTLGFGRIRDSGVNADEPVNFGFGPSVRFYRKNSFFSTPTAGLHYTPETKEFQYLLSSSISLD